MLQPAAQCKKWLGFTGRGHNAEVLDDAGCIRQLKRWLLLGLDVPRTGGDRQLQHRDVSGGAAGTRSQGPVPGEDDEHVYVPLDFLSDGEEDNS